jgi:lysophospholipid acyltransferase (LPLAT)-like uncharacterized protein
VDHNVTGSNWGRRWRRVQGNALFAYSRLVALTSRYRIEGWRQLSRAEASGHPILWALWHGQMMLFITFGDRHLPNDQFAAVRVGDERGDVLGAYGDRLGTSTYRVNMEGNPFAAGRAVLQVIRAMKAGKQSAIAPDGPDGPAYVPKRGVTFLARKAEAALLPVGLWTRQAYALNRWDHYLVPFPFARIDVTIGEPLFVDRQADETMLETRLVDALHQARARAQVLAGVRPWE